MPPSHAFRPRDFRVTKVFKAYRHQAGRAAVLRAFLSRRKAPHTTTPVAATKVLAAVRKVWVARLWQLRAAGWPRLAGETAVVYAANCPPTGVETKTRTNRCWLTQVCPFCYTRYRVLEPFGRLEAALFGDPHAGRVLLRPDLAVLWFRRRRVVSAPGVPFDLDHLAAHAAHAVAMMRRTRRFEAARFGAAFGTVQFAVYPSVREGGVVMRRSGVLLVPAGTPQAALDEYLAVTGPGGGLPDKVAAAFLPPTRKGLAGAFAAAARYPAGLLRADPAWAAAGLAALKGAQLASPVGRLKTTFKGGG